MLTGCSSSKKTTESTQEGKYVYYSGNISGLDYIMVHKIINGKKQYTLTVDCNHYITGIGKTIFFKKTLYYPNTKDYSTLFLIKDASMLSGLSLVKNANNSFEKLSDEEYEIIKKSFTKYPVLTAKYSLNADSLKDYLGWFEIKK